MNDEQTPALRQAVENMANMREVYNNLSQAAEAYNTGKIELAQNITAKGVQASATETLPELAEKVAAITQETHEINGGEIYAKQLFADGNMHNLYDIYAQIKSNGNYSAYSGFVLALYFKGYATIPLQGADAYLTSDGDFYDYSTTHTWHDKESIYTDRWVAYFMIDSTSVLQFNTTSVSPRKAIVGGTIGCIQQSVAGRISELIVPDGNELGDFQAFGDTAFSGSVVIRNVKEHKQGSMFYSNTGYSVYIQVDKLSGGTLFGTSTFIRDDLYNGLVSITFDVGEITGGYLLDCNSGGLSPSIIRVKRCKVINREVLRFTRGNPVGQCDFYFDDVEIISGTLIAISHNGGSKIESLRFPKIKQLSGTVMTMVEKNICTLSYVLLGCCGQKSDTVNLSIGTTKIDLLTDIEIGDKENIDAGLQPRWQPCQNINVSFATYLTEENMYTHILQRLKQDEPYCGDDVTITLGATNLAKLTSAESVTLLDSLTNVYGYTFA